MSTPEIGTVVFLWSGRRRVVGETERVRVEKWKIMKRCMNINSGTYPTSFLKTKEEF